MLLNQGQALVRSTFPWTFERKGFRRSGFKRGSVLGQGFIYMEIWGNGFRTKQSSVRDGYSSGVHIHGNIKGKVLEKVAVKEECLFLRGSFTWKYKGECFRMS